MIDKVLVITLLKGNGGCTLPCWWGITPGQSRWETAYDYFKSLGEEPVVLPSYTGKGYTIGFRDEQEGFNTHVMFFVDNGIIRVIAPGAEVTPDNYALTFDSPFYSKVMKQYSLVEILSKYGQPAQILIRVMPVQYPPLWDFYTLLYYPDEGILVEYTGQSQKKADQHVLCMKNAFVNMWLWSPDDKMSLSDVYAYQGAVERETRYKFLSYFKPIDAATKYTPETFTQTFIEPNNCLETSIDQWK